MKRMTRMTRIFALFLAAVVCTSAMNLQTYAAETVSVNELPSVTEETTQAEETAPDSQLPDTTEEPKTEVPETGEPETEEPETQEPETEEPETGDAQGSWDGVTTQSVYEGENYKVTFKLNSHWENGYGATVRIENTGAAVIRNWHLAFDSALNPADIWNAKIQKSEGGHYIIQNAGWNKDIAPGSSVEFGFGGKEKFVGFPLSYQIVGENAETNKEEYTVTYRLESDWGNGFSANIAITNNTVNILEDWVLEFDFDRSIQSIWNGKIESTKENHYAIRNAGFNSNIAPGQTVSFGFNGKGGTKTDEPENYKLLTYDAFNTAYKTVTFDLDYEQPSAIPEEQKVVTGEFAIKPEAPKRADFYFLGWYTDTTYSEYFDFEKTSITKDITLFARWFSMDDTADTDGDGIIDSLEELFGTDKTKADTDGDGLSDYIEIDQMGTDPLKMDTDDNGINDSEEDNDKDGLNNLLEVKHGTNPNAPDTDEDGLNDSAEINTYGTDPLKQDTDGDGVSDGKEVELKTDPLTVQTSFQVTAAAEEGAVKASVSVELSGKQVETLTVEQTANAILFPDEIPGYIGEAYDFKVDGTFDAATISFAFNSQLLGTENFQPTVYYFNEEEQKLEALKTTVNGSTASAVVEHFSTYLLINRKVYEDSFTWTDVWSTNSYTGAEVVFVIDDSGSMTSYDRYNDRLKVARTLIDKLPENSKAGIVKFESYTRILTKTLTDNKETAKSYLTKDYFRSSGGTNMYNAINAAFPLFESKEETVLKMMVVISDGETNDTGLHSTVVQSANNKGVKVYTVGLGSSTSYFTRYLEPLANNTGGSFYLASDASKLEKIYEEISQKIDIETDSDKDGISDYYEDHMVIFNGVKWDLDKN